MIRQHQVYLEIGHENLEIPTARTDNKLKRPQPPLGFVFCALFAIMGVDRDDTVICAS
jgi:hypothetical protein